MRIGVVSFSDLDRDPRVRRQVSTFLEAGWRVHALLMGGSINNERLAVTRVGIERRRTSRLRYLLEYAVFMARTTAWSLILTIRRDVDVVYVNSPPDIMSLACLPSKLAGIPVILDVHDPMPELWEAKGQSSRLWARLLEWQEHIGIRFADAVITVHEPMRALLATRNPDRDIAVVMNVPDIPDSRAFPEDTQSRLLVFAGTVAFRYGLDDVLRAMALISDEVPSLQLRVIGEGEDVEQLQELSLQLGVSVEFVGRVPYADVRQAQEGAWVGVNVPKPDLLGELSFSNKVVEWVALGLPVLAGETKTLKTYFPVGAVEYVRQGDPAAIAEGIRRLDRMSTEERSTRIEQAKLALERISWPKQQERLLQVVNEAQSG